MTQKPILNDHQNWVTQTQYSKLRRALEALEGNPEGLPDELYQAQKAAIRSVMDELRQAMEDYTRHLMETGEMY